ncbi:class I SAM-dependent methyltransferase [Jannaschia pohangensis]|uniref:SAM-dependent methyltransferase, MidA family n=1 Tax=Jannaschia pohangensis TaxID=390807 RepID=A0A1I3MPF8_9RHOB|nr:SAM-dependent methyltransferase [Jannaschia pohangensis]SFI98839.1 SAM-dependent methyltransferase, MidA family [Jannaschia pohangensis]
MTGALRDHLLHRIRTTGPMTVADYMADCLLHPTMGYYTTRDPFGAAGDFTTAPEISQMFGEMLGLCLAQTWQDQGSPARFALAELGPGRGTLMADILRVGRAVPGFTAAARVHLVEASPTLRDVQARTLAGHTPIWHAGVDDLPDDLPLFLVANEFLDALPIRQYVRAVTGWHERLVSAADEALTFALSPPMPVPELDPHSVQPGTMVERCPALPAVVGAVAARVARGGAAIFVDYGHWDSRGDTLQALRDHAFDDPLAHPGQADLTAHVDFAAIAAAAPPCEASPMVTQGLLLERLGITARAQALARGLTGPALDTHVAAHRRLTHPAEMGDLFKALALVPPGAAMPPGFAA